MATRLEELRLNALVDRAAAELELGRAGKVLAELEMLAIEHPVHERLARFLMTALATLGRQADALRCYERIRARLADELGVDPSADLQSIHVRVLRCEIAPKPADRAPARTNLKAQLTSFVGRDDDVLRVGKALQEVRLVTLVGSGGAGKTRLAAEAASRLDAVDGVWLIEPAPVTDAAAVAQTVLGFARAARVADAGTAHRADAIVVLSPHQAGEENHDR